MRAITAKAAAILAGLTQAHLQELANLEPALRQALSGSAAPGAVPDQTPR